MKVTHLNHSGFLVELDHHLLLFDYIKGDLQLNPLKPLYIFVTHSHDDHYHPSIFHIQHPHIHYIFSDSMTSLKKAFFVKANHTYTIDDIVIQTLLSTDEGCAFIVNVESQRIYHAGDLHWWHWEGEDPQDNDYQARVYQQQINLIENPINIAFVVVDQRLEDAYLLGLQYFLEHVPCQYIFPMHYFGDYTITQKLQHVHLNNPYHAKIMAITHSQQSFIL